MKKAKSALLLALCAVLLVGATVAGTVAYLTSKTEVVQNTFTVGHVAITLDEKDIDNDTNAADNVTVDGVVRDRANKYHLIPGGTYEKDPTVHVQANSEDSWVFVKVENELVNYEGANKIHDQILANDWTVLPGAEGVYYKSYTKTNSVVDMTVFTSVTIAGDNAQGADWSAVSGKTIKVTAYAIQKANGAGTFEVADAWAVVGN